MTREVLANTQGRTLRDLRALLTQNLVPRREAAIRVSEEVQTLNRAAFVQHQTDIADIHRIASRRTWQQVGLALVLSLAIALLFSIYAGRLESHLLGQMQTNENNARQLQHLSTRLMNAQEEERRSVSRELHDEVGQALTAVQVELSVAQRRLTAAGHPADVLTDAASITQATLQTCTRHLSTPASGTAGRSWPCRGGRMASQITAGAARHHRELRRAGAEQAAATRH